MPRVAECTKLGNLELSSAKRISAYTCFELCCCNWLGSRRHNVSIEQGSCSELNQAQGGAKHLNYKLPTLEVRTLKKLLRPHETCSLHHHYLRTLFASSGFDLWATRLLVSWNCGSIFQLQTATRTRETPAAGAVRSTTSDDPTSFSDRTSRPTSAAMSRNTFGRFKALDRYLMFSRRRGDDFIHQEERARKLPISLVTPSSLDS